MANLKGTQWRDLIKSPEYYARQTRETLAPIVSRLSAVANKRLKRMEQSGIEYSNYEGSDSIAGVKKFGAVGKTLGQLRAEYKRLEGFLSARLSTLTGRKEEYYQAKARAWETATSEDKKRMGKKPTKKEAYKEYESAKKRYRESKKGDRPLQRLPDKTEIFDEVARLFEISRKEGWKTKTDSLYKQWDSKQMQNYFQEQVIRANIFGADNVIDYVRKSIGVEGDELEELPDDTASTSKFF